MLDGGSGNDVLEGGDGDDVLRGGGSGTSVTDVLRGGAGNDTLSSATNSGYYTANTLEGGTGNDLLTGSHYADHYLFNLGDGQDVISDLNGGVGTHAAYQDKLVFGAGIAPSDVRGTRVGNDLVLSLANGTAQITVKSWYLATANKIELTTFADGTSLTSTQVESLGHGQLFTACHPNQQRRDL